jgi:lactoylglutathione lyase
MRIDHVAIWTRNLERLKAFYEGYLGAAAGPRYVNPAKQFVSYFLTFETGARLELMSASSLHACPQRGHGNEAGYAHLAIAVGSRGRVDELTASLRAAGVTVADGPRQTGDGYYESVILDPDGNRIELTAS